MRRKVIALVLAVCLVFAGTAVVWSVNNRAILSRVENTLSDEISTALGAKLEAGRIEIIGWNALALHDFTLYDKQGREMIKGGTVTVSVNVFNLLRGRSVIETLTDVNVTASAVFLRRGTDNRWNFEDFTEPKRAEDAVFHGRILIKDAKAHVFTPEGQWAVDGIQGEADFSRYPAVALVFSGEQGKTSFQIKGTVNSQGRSGLEMIADNIVLEEYIALLPVTENGALTAGVAKRLSAFVQYEKDSLTYAGEVQFAGVAGRADRFAVEDVSGKIAFTEKSLHFFDTTAKVAGQPMEIDGQIGLGGSEPAFDLAVSSPGCSLAAFMKESPLSGPVLFQARLTGTPSAPVIEGDAALSQGEVQGYSISDAAAHLQFSGQTLTIHAAHAAVLGGVLTAAGQINITDQTAQLKIAGHQIELEALTGLASASSLNAAGAIDFRADVTASGENYSQISVNAAASMSAGQLSGISVNNAYAGFYRQEGSFTLDYLTADFAGGFVIAAGGLDHNGWNMTIRGQDVQLAALTAVLPGLDIAGKASFSGGITGSRDEPEFNGAFTAEDGRILFQPYRQASGRLQINRRTAAIFDGRMVDGATSHEVTGTIGLDGERLVALQMISRQARAENLVKLLAPGEKLTGNVDNEVILSGSLANLNAVGQVTLTEGSFRGYLLPKVTGKYQRQQGITKLDHFIVNALELQAQVSGRIDSDNNLDVDIQAQDIDLARLRARYPYPVSGLASFSGRLKGTLADPHLEGQFSADRLTLNGQAMEMAAATISINQGGIDIPYLAFQQGQGKVIVLGGIEWPSNEINGSIVVDNGQLAPILAILNVQLPGVDGKLNGQINVNGTLENPGLHITGGLVNGNIKNYPLDNIDIDVILENNILSIRQLMAKQGDGILAMQGTADLNGPLALEIGGRNIDAGLLKSWFNSSLEIKGQLNVAAQISGTAKAPYAAVSLDIANGGVASATFDQLYGLFIYDKDNIEISQLFLSKGPYRTSAYGRVPLAALQADKNTRLSSTEQMDIKFRLDQADLRILPWLTKEVAWATGPTQGEVTISGTLANPDFRGNISIAEGAVKLKALDDPIQKMVLDIQLEGDTIRLKSFSGQMGAGSFRMEGAMDFRNLVLGNYDLDMTLNHLALNHKYFRGPVNGKLHLTEANGKPLISGKVEFENDSINIPGVPEFAQSDLDIGLDVEAVTAPRIRFHNPYMYDIWAEGNIKITGSSQNPAVTGGLSAVRGTVSYLRTPFRVRYGTVRFLHEGSMEPTVKLIAETSLSQTKVFLNVDGSVQQLDIKLTSEPAMNQQEILSLLTLRSRYADQANAQGAARDSGLGRNEVFGLMSTGLQMAFMNEMEASFRNVFGLDEFRFIEGSATENGSRTTASASSNFNKQVYSVEFGKYITDRLFISYTMGVGHDESSAAFRYDITRRISLTGTVDDQNRKWIGLEARFSF
ncbi:MAG: hypothetical protein H6Q66_96 [Firmicutes bacterium]|nr:hypothetical protein [Bacillota bacterium]